MSGLAKNLYTARKASFYNGPVNHGPKGWLRKEGVSRELKVFDEVLFLMLSNQCTALGGAPHLHMCAAITRW